ncbi:MAG: hypothetical protein PHQ18_05010 [Patescibacteria group bacterium]|nr:hypothetical protein [Patescibacteria group bacterium]
MIEVDDVKLPDTSVKLKSLPCIAVLLSVSTEIITFKTSSPTIAGPVYLILAAPVAHSTV